MTNNIEKLYELAGVGSVGCYDCPLFIDEIICLGIAEEKTCPYPPFTESKQLELIKWLAKNITFGFLIHTYDSKFRFNIFKNRAISHKDFSQALAGLVCELWEDLTPEQREEVRGILE